MVVEMVVVAAAATGTVAAEKVAAAATAEEATAAAATATVAVAVAMGRVVVGRVMGMEMGVAETVAAVRASKRRRIWHLMIHLYPTQALTSTLASSSLRRPSHAACRTHCHTTGRARQRPRACR